MAHWPNAQDPPRIVTFADTHFDSGERIGIPSGASKVVFENVSYGRAGSQIILGTRLTGTGESESDLVASDYAFDGAGDLSIGPQTTCTAIPNGTVSIEFKNLTFRGRTEVTFRPNCPNRLSFVFDPPRQKSSNNAAWIVALVLVVLVIIAAGVVKLRGRRKT